ncbi:MAG: hypothetical protein WC819_03245 [Parcubacteria group bacterium]|jgi:hypothetical protein
MRNERGRYFTKTGRRLLVIMLAVLIGIFLWQSKKETPSRQVHALLTLKDCAPPHEGITFHENMVTVNKTIIFCNCIAEWEKIPVHTMIILANGTTILPIEESSTAAVFPTSLHHIAKENWHIIAK